MAGFLSSLSSVLQSPAVQELLPTALGAAGGFLTTPRRAGAGGAIGNAMLGAAGGMTTGMEAAARAQEAQNNAKHLALLNQQAEQALKERKADQPTLAGLLGTAAKTTVGKAVFGPNADFSNIDPTIGSKLFDQYTHVLEASMKGQKPTVKIVQTPGADGKPEWSLIEADPSGNVTTKPLMSAYQDPMKEAVLGASIERSEAGAEASRAAAAVSGARLRGTLPAAAESPDLAAERKAQTDLAVARRQQLGKAGAAKPETEAQIKAHNLAVERLISSEGGKAYDELLKTYWVKSNAPDRDQWLKDYHDRRIKELNEEIDAMPAHAKSGEGLPEGSHPNGDGSWTIPNGKRVWPR